MVKVNVKIQWIEGLRFFAIMLVVVTHFIAHFCPQLFVLWDSYSILLKGISGKLGVSIFCVLIGYFASKPSALKLPDYLVQRYLQLALNIFIIVICYLFLMNIINGQLFCRLFPKGIKEALFFRDSIIPTFWCVKDIFWGSVTCYILGNFCEIENKVVKLLFLTLFVVFLYNIGLVWISICVLGVIFRFIENIEFKKRLRIVNIFICIMVIPILYRHEESNGTYMMQGVACCLFMYVVKNIVVLRKILGNKVFVMGGGISFYMFLIHTPVNWILTNILNIEDFNMWCVFFLSFGFTIILSYAMYVFNNQILMKLIKKIHLK